MPPARFRSWRPFLQPTSSSLAGSGRRCGRHRNQTEPAAPGPVQREVRRYHHCLPDFRFLCLSHKPMARPTANHCMIKMKSDTIPDVSRRDGSPVTHSRDSHMAGALSTAPTGGNATVNSIWRTASRNPTMAPNRNGCFVCIFTPNVRGQARRVGGIPL